jgi:hypothetical protein
MFDDLSKAMEEGQERWKKIEELVTEVEYGLSHSTPTNRALYELVILLVDHLRPMNPSQEQLDEATNGLTDLLKALKK